MRRAIHALLSLLMVSGCRSTALVTPPGQPASGPGGAEYAHRSAVAQRFGEGADEYWIMTPADPVPPEAPVVAFLHAWGAVDPRVYGAWLRHIVRKGYIVVYPRYQGSLFTGAADMLAAAIRAVKDARDRLESAGEIRPAADRMAWVGHSLGGIISANLAASFAETGLPPPAALMAVAPGGESRLAVADLGTLPSETLVLLVAAEDDRAVADHGVKAIHAVLTHMPVDHVGRITIRSDRRSDPPLVANHTSPLAWSSFQVTTPEDDAPQTRQQLRSADRFAPDALDFYGYWKLLDGLLDAAFHGQNREFALGGTPQQRFMGVLSNGDPVNPLTVE